MSRIELKNISVTFKQNKKEITAVEDVSFAIEAGEIFGIVGLSGAGKSTLVRTINLLQRPSSGQVLIDGVDVTSAKGKQLKEIRKKIGMIFQHFNLIGNKTISQNIEFALKAGGYPADNREKRVNELLELVDLSEKKHAYPANLSGGQKQRVGIARALANNPEILLCDEATSALDVETTEEILRILEKINKELGLTIIFITHEMEVAKRLFNRIAVMENGRVVELGSTYEVFAKPQAAMSKKLVGRYLNLSISAKIMESFSEGVLIELHYQGDSTLDPLISQISKEYEVFISITHGKIEYINEQPIGILIVYVTGAKSDVKAASEKLQAQVSYTRILNDPIHCLEVDV